MVPVPVPVVAVARPVQAALPALLRPVLSVVLVQMVVVVVVVVVARDRPIMQVGPKKAVPIDMSFARLSNRICVVIRPSRL